MIGQNPWKWEPLKDQSKVECSRNANIRCNWKMVHLWVGGGCNMAGEALDLYMLVTMAPLGPKTRNRDRRSQVTRFSYIRYIRVSGTIHNSQESVSVSQEHYSCLPGFLGLLETSRRIPGASSIILGAGNSILLGNSVSVISLFSILAAIICPQKQLNRSQYHKEMRLLSSSANHLQQ